MELYCIICVTITLVIAGFIALIYNVSTGRAPYRRNTGSRTNHYYHYDNEFDSTGTGGVLNMINPGIMEMVDE